MADTAGTRRWTESQEKAFLAALTLVMACALIGTSLVSGRSELTEALRDAAGLFCLPAIFAVSRCRRLMDWPRLWLGQLSLWVPMVVGIGYFADRFGLSGETILLSLSMSAAIFGLISINPRLRSWLFARDADVGG